MSAVCSHYIIINVAIIPQTVEFLPIIYTLLVYFLAIDRNDEMLCDEMRQTSSGLLVTKVSYEGIFRTSGVIMYFSNVYHSSLAFVKILKCVVSSKYYV